MKKLIIQALVFIICLWVEEICFSEDIIWTRSLNYSGVITKENEEFVIIKVGGNKKKIMRKNIEDITYSQKTNLSMGEQERITAAERKLEKAMLEEKKWREDHPEEYEEMMAQYEYMRRLEQKRSDRIRRKEKKRMEQMLDNHQREEKIRKEKLKNEIREYEIAAQKRQRKIEMQQSNTLKRTQLNQQRNTEQVANVDNHTSRRKRRVTYSSSGDSSNESQYFIATSGGKTAISSGGPVIFKNRSATYSSSGNSSNRSRSFIATSGRKTAISTGGPVIFRKKKTAGINIRSLKIGSLD